MKETQFQITDEQRAQALAGETVEIYKPEAGGRLMITERDGAITIQEFSATAPTPDSDSVSSPEPSPSPDRALSG